MTEKRLSDMDIEEKVDAIYETIVGNLNNKKKSILGRLDLNEAAIKRIYAYLAVLTGLIVYVIKT